jgi:hypothetical protein
MLYWLRRLFGLDSPIQRRMPRPLPPQDKPDPYMDEGDYHSGPHGYSPNTAYPETQYGSNFDEDAEWNEDERR